MPQSPTAPPARDRLTPDAAPPLRIPLPLVAACGCGSGCGCGCQSGGPCQCSGCTH
ncbi:hypothetical protein RVR_5750 [Actinacidiphila reveromycinica]|uniref:Metallothionein n=1 Tax=Actinacidiphila reveromycinica TaxID=659352 RepID=A0A7U3UUZ6_9ACTN|nr:hypothetical protein [Streptomyces sp. SN-593]BBA99220.1 hypothetical protein RVR_5750 [Streptomyces sp. SN-593]